ncbi:hypothetical protein DM01DRAFT_1405381 [Hesseltinella vesiculosa]|uniref:F-box domain-containing protein n=1 Tax=Hesseltinella vesiculosa TaxID=101127 RepID=A0A1X2GPT1_9FUNG|nr:hypothetical protein DM01DRAFT_1405381 [Hesseltinella vesiculosa]
MTTLLALPLEILQQIVSHLTSDDILTCCCVCKTIHHAVYPNLFHHVFIRNGRALTKFLHSLNTNMDDAEHSLGCATRDLRLRFCRMNVQQLQDLTTHCPRLTSLDIDHFTWSQLINKEYEHQRSRLTFTNPEFALNPDMELGQLITHLAPSNHPTPPTVVAGHPKPASGRDHADVAFDNSTAAHPDPASPSASSSRHPTIDYRLSLNAMVATLTTTPLSELRSHLFSRLLKTTFQHYHHLTALHLDLDDGLSRSVDIYHILDLVPHLLHLKLNHAFHILTITDIEYVHNACRHLKHLELTGFCLNRLQIGQHHSIAKNHVLESLVLRFSSGWSYYWHWLWYIGRKYASQLKVLECNCTASMGLYRALDGTAIIQNCYSVFAQQHAASLQQFSLVNLSTSQDLWHQMIQSSQPTSPSPAATNITKAKFTNQHPIGDLHLIRSILTYLKPSIQDLVISLPNLNDAGPFGCVLDVMNGLHQCTYLTRLTLKLPPYVFAPPDHSGVGVALDTLLRHGAHLKWLAMEHGTLSLVDAVPPNHPLTGLELHHVNLSTSFLCSGLMPLNHLKHITLAKCVIHCTYGIPNDVCLPVSMAWHFPPHRSLHVDLNYLRFYQCGNLNGDRLNDITLYELSTDRARSWMISHDRRVVPLTESMGRRSAGELRRRPTTDSRRGYIEYDFVETEVDNALADEVIATRTTGQSVLEQQYCIKLVVHAMSKLTINQHIVVHHRR